MSIADVGVAGICVAVGAIGGVIVIVAVGDGVRVAVEVAAVGISTIPVSLPHKS